MPRIKVQIGTRRRVFSWAPEYEPTLNDVEDYVERLIHTEYQIHTFTLTYIGGWSWQLYVDDRMIGRIAILKDK